MAPRPNWKGFLKLSLVSCAVALYPATSTSQRIRFNIINRKTGNRIRNEVVDAETGDPVDQEDRIKGFQYDKGEYILLEDDELDGLARVVIYRREHLLLLAPRGKGLMATALRYNTEVRDQKNYFDDIDDIKVPADMLKLAVQILDSKKGKFDPGYFEDRYERALMALIKAKQAGKKPPELAEERPSNVINLMDALRKSARADSGRRSKRAAPSKASARKRTTSRKKVRKAS